MNKQVYIRVEGNQNVGWGHFIRCLALSEMIPEQFEVKFVGMEVPENLLSNRKKNLFRIEEEKQFFDILNENSIVVVDGYNFDEFYYQNLKATGAKIVSIQDIHHFSHNIDVVINHLPGTEDFYENVDLLSGPRHAVIRKKFLKSPGDENCQPNEVFISLGGTENFLLVNKIIAFLNNYDDNLNISVLTTEENKKQIEGENLSFFVNIDEDEIINLIDQSSICFITSGMISYEVLARNKKAIVGALNKGQDEVGRQFEKMNLIEYVGFWKDIDEVRMLKALNGSNINKDKVKSIFDGKSDERIRNKFLSL